MFAGGMATAEVVVCSLMAMFCTKAGRCAVLAFVPHFVPREISILHIALCDCHVHLCKGQPTGRRELPGSLHSLSSCKFLVAAYASAGHCFVVPRLNPPAPSAVISCNLWLWSRL